jgi:glutamyl-tRNA synthetase
VADQKLRAVTAQLKDRSKKITELADNAFYFFREPERYEESAAKKHFKGDAAGLLFELAAAMEKTPEFNHASLEELYRAVAGEKNVGAGKLIHPTRLAISGVSYGPGLFELMELLGREKVVARMRRAAKRLSSRGQ